MAVKVKYIGRPIESVITAGEYDGEELADKLLVKVDRYDTGRVVVVLELLFSDYAGLETEWDAGTATTVLEAAITTAIHATTWPDDQLTSAQRNVLGVNFTES